MTEPKQPAAALISNDALVKWILVAVQAIVAFIGTRLIGTVDRLEDAVQSQELQYVELNTGVNYIKDKVQDLDTRTREIERATAK